MCFAVNVDCHLGSCFAGYDVNKDGVAIVNTKCLTVRACIKVIHDMWRLLRQRWYQMCGSAHVIIHEKLRSEPGQGTTEYAILVGVLVVIAIVAITLFKPKVEELWNAIATGINGL